LSEVDDEGIKKMDLDYGTVFNYSTGGILGIYSKLDVDKPEWFPDSGNHCGFIL